jgi:hypothetical protein
MGGTSLQMSGTSLQISLDLIKFFGVSTSVTSMMSVTIMNPSLHTHNLTTEVHFWINK